MEQPAAGPAVGTVSPQTADEFRISGPLLIRDAAERAAQLRQALDAGTCAFDLGDITAIDTAGIQLLVAVAHEAARRQLALQLRGCAAVVAPAAQALGVAPLLHPLMTGVA